MKKFRFGTWLVLSAGSLLLLSQALPAENVAANAEFWRRPHSPAKHREAAVVVVEPGCVSPAAMQVWHTPSSSKWWRSTRK